MEKEQTVLVFTELTISEEASVSGGDIVQGGYAFGGSVSDNGFSVSPGGEPSVVIFSDPLPFLKDIGKAFSKTKVD